MLYKKGDRVRIKSLEWYDANKDEDGDVDIFCGFTKDMRKFCDKEAIISIVYNNSYGIDIDGGEYRWTDEMIEGLVSEEKQLISADLIKDIAEVIKTHNLGVSVSENEGKLIIEPLKAEKEEYLERGTYIMCTNDVNNEPWILRQYLSNGVCDSYKTDTFTLPPIPFRYIIPFDKFNPKDIKESLKYNIVKNNQ